MQPTRFLVGIAAAAIFVSSALAEDHPCVQPQDPLVVALCSDPELCAVADRQGNAMLGLWNRLSPQEQEKFRNNQRAWRDITALGCGVDRPTPLPLSAETKTCLEEAEAARIVYLQHYGQTNAPTALHPDATAPGTPAISPPAESDAYRAGLRDRAAWEQWFNDLQGDNKTGAFFWASQRSLPKPGSCKQMNDDFYAGCTAAKTRLSASDTRRKTEPDYKAGWNAYNTPAAAPATTPPSAASPPAPGRQVAAGPGWSVTVNGGNVAEASGSQAAAVSTRDRGYNAVTFEDFLLDGKDGLLTDDATRNVRKYFLECQNNPVVVCEVTILGRATMCERTIWLNSTSVACLTVDDGE